MKTAITVGQVLAATTLLHCNAVHRGFEGEPQGVDVLAQEPEATPGGDGRDEEATEGGGGNGANRVSGPAGGAVDSYGGAGDPGSPSATEAGGAAAAMAAEQSPELSSPGTGGQLGTGGTLGAAASDPGGGSNQPEPGFGDNSLPDASSMGGMASSGGMTSAGGAPGAGGVAASGGDTALGGTMAFGGTSSGGANGGTNSGAGGAPDDGCPDEWVDVCGATCSELRGPNLVLVEAGSLAVGSDDLPNTSPPVTFQFDALCVDQTEVTVAQYRECVDAGGCAEPDVGISAECNWAYADREDHPVTCVGRNEAVTYCEWAGKRLPNEREWEYAARGTEGRLYPWGSEVPDSTRLHWANETNGTMPVGSYPLGATPETQIFDLAGNVWEWTENEWCESHEASAPCTPGLYLARGGSYASTLPEHVRPSWRDNVNAGDQRFGFRCVVGPGQR